jgi:hypothetical protein
LCHCEIGVGRNGDRRCLCEGWGCIRGLSMLLVLTDPAKNPNCRSAGAIVIGDLTNLDRVNVKLR